MNNNVVTLPVTTTLDLDPDRVLEEAKGKLEHCVIIGYTKDGGEYFASSIADAGTVAWLMDKAKLKLMNICDDES